MKKAWLILILFSFTIKCFGNNWYVTVTGNDQYDGRSLKSSFQSLQKAADVVEAGDVVLIGGGVYTVPRTLEGPHVLNIKHSGEADAWITWKAIKGQQPIIRPTGWAGILVAASYQIFDGLTIIGYNDSIFLLEAINDAKNKKPDPYFNSNGIFINGRNNTIHEKPHHIIIQNCDISKCPGGGIAIIEADYVTVEDCKISENAWFMRYGGSGISTLNNWAFDDDPGYHMIIQGNFVWNNKTMVPWGEIGRLSDGNGIILDVTDQEDGAKNPNGDAAIKPESNDTHQLKPRRPEWKGRTLVANNVSVYNGGSGIHAFRTSHADIINNTTYWNGQIVGYPEMFANTCRDIYFLNNIIVPRPAGKVTSDTHNIDQEIHWDYNLSTTGQAFFKAPNDIIADPSFEKVDPIKPQESFQLSKNSKGRNNGSKEKSLKIDIVHHKRPQGEGIDRGAYEK